MKKVFRFAALYRNTKSVDSFIRGFKDEKTFVISPRKKLKLLKILLKDQITQKLKTTNMTTMSANK